jgi:chemotaxis protein methyltransferase CheR
MTPVLSDATMHAFSECVANHIGMRIAPERWADVRRAASELLRDARMPFSLSSPLARPDIEALAQAVCVGETYFLRDPDTFEMLERELLPPLIAARRHTSRRLRLWSAGCSTGEECYSLAIVLHRLIPDIADWDITILGTDIHPGFIRRAEEGRYGDWSFRGVPDHLRELYFEPSDAQNHAVRPFIKCLTRFGHLNLAQDFDVGTEFDLVLCRHVLMYFDKAQAEQTVQRLRAAIVEGGCLIVGPTEAGAGWYAGFERIDGSYAHRKVAMPHVEPGQPAPPMPTPPKGVAIPDQPAHDHRLHDALIACEVSLSRNKCDPSLHCLHGILLEECGDLVKAKEAQRRALFLDPDFVLAHVALGRLNQRQGRSELAARHFDHVLRTCLGNSAE